jgi:hypothetical protein
MDRSAMGVHGVLCACWLLLGMALAACTTPIEPQPVAGPPPPYDYNIVNPYVATVVGTPPALAAQVPEQINVTELDLRVFPERPIPQVFWYADRLQYSLVYQARPAPLIFLIAGTGAGHDSIKSTYLQRVFFQAGYHVISLPSPTYPDFMISASTNGVPGRAANDAEDLYRVMRLAYERVKDRIQVTAFHLTGYSLGAWHAAFVAELDAKQKAFDFSKVLLINPPVSLYTSAQRLDAMLVSNIPGGNANIGVLVQNLINQLASVYQSAETLNFRSEYILYRLYLQLQPSDEELEALIGLAFRFASANLVFTSDVLTDSGLIVPKNLQLTPVSSLTDYFDVSIRVGFIEYFDDLYYPFYEKGDPTITKEELIRQASLESIQDYLAGAENVGMITNEDDIMLSPGQVEFLAKVFGPRAQIYPTGGHVGNLATRAVTAYVADFFRR